MLHGRAPGIAELAAAGLLPQTLSKLCSPRDFALCGAVCKTWRSVVTSLDLKRLRLHIDPEEVSISFCVGLRYWLALQLKQGSLANLTEFSLHAPAEKEIDDSRDTTALSSLYAAAITAVGTSSLQICQLTDCTTLLDAVQLLPASLQELRVVYLDMDTPLMLYPEDAVISLSDFSRFCNLKKLCLDIPTSNEFEADYGMPKMQHLEIANASFSVTAGIPISDCLPVIECLQVTLEVTDEADTTRLAQALLQFVPKLDLSFNCVLAYTTKLASKRLELTITESSFIQALRIDGNDAVQVTLTVKKLIKVQKNKFVNIELL